MKYRPLGYALLLPAILIFASACGGPNIQQQVGGDASPAPTFESRATSPLQPTAVAEPATSPTSVIQQEDAWKQVRAALPADVAVYQPTFVPQRFGAPRVLEAHAGSGDDLAYTIVYTAKDENLAFILNMGKGALGNFPPAELNEPITIRGVNGSLSIASEAHAMGVFWQEQQGRSYQIKAFSRQMTKDEMERIVKSVVPVASASATSAP
jgi:hypothetical protein